MIAVAASIQPENSTNQLVTATITMIPESQSCIDIRNTKDDNEMMNDLRTRQHRQ